MPSKRWLWPLRCQVSARYIKFGGSYRLSRATGYGQREGGSRHQLTNEPAANLPPLVCELWAGSASVSSMDRPQNQHRPNRGYLKDLEVVELVDRCVDSIKTGHG